MNATQKTCVIFPTGMQQAKLEGIITSNPADAVKIPKADKVKKERFIMTQDEQDRFLNTIQDDRLFPLFAFAILTGCRQGEILAMQWNKNIDLENKTINVTQSVATVNDRSGGDKKTKTIVTAPKTASSMRVVPMCIELYAIILKHKENQYLEKERLREAYNHNDYVFATMDGKMLNYRNVIRKLHQLLEKANIPKINFHSLRHLFASRLIQNNVSMKIVQEYLGHASYNLTANTYSHVIPEIKRAEIEQLNSIFSSVSKNHN